MDDPCGLVPLLMKRCEAKGQLSLPALPAMLDHYVPLLVATFQGLGCPFTDAEQSRLRELLGARLEEAFGITPASEVIVDYERSGAANGVYYSMGVRMQSMAEQYGHWQAARKPELFGKHADAKVLDVARGLPAGSRCLDLGAGSGRNSVPLAQLGLQVDAVEMTPELAQTLLDRSRRLGVSLRVLQADALDSELALDLGAYDLIVVSEVVSHFRDTDDLASLLQRISSCLAPGGSALVNSFLVDKPEELSALVRQAAEVLWSTFFSTPEFVGLAELHGLCLVSNEPVLDYEKSRAPSWPPTSWYESWAGAEDVFGGPPPIGVSFRWLVLQRAEAVPRIGSTHGSHRPGP